MERWICEGCGYIYDESRGDPDNKVEAGTDWFEIPRDWVCPVCGLGTESFSAEEE